MISSNHGAQYPHIHAMRGEENAMVTLKQSISVLLIIFMVLALSACGGGGEKGAGGEAAGEVILVSINVVPDHSSNAKGTTQQYTATGVYSDHTNKDITLSVTWSSSATIVATINNSGLATSISTGKTFVMATLSGVTSNLVLHTVTTAALTSISITPDNPSITIGTSQQFAATGIFSATGVLLADTTTQDITTRVTWNSSNTGMATIDSAGLVTATAVGSTTITAVLGNISGTGTLTVTTVESVSGSLDKTFGTEGKVITGVGTVASGNDAAYAMAIQGDGKIVTAGQAFVRQSIDGSSFPPDFALVRYNVDGSLDSTFGNGGKVTTAAGRGGGSNDVAFQSDGRIVVAGFSLVDSKSNFTVARYNVDGSLDGTFGTGGLVITPVGTGNAWGSSVSIQSDGKIVVGGDCWNDSSYFDFALVRYNEDGSLDSSFGTGGKVTTDIINSDDGGNKVTIQGDGKIVIAGNASRESARIWDIALARYNADGSLDSSFGTAGKVSTIVGSGSYVSDVAIQNDGKVVAAGRATVNSAHVFTLVRYTVDGSLDSTFGTGGIVTTSFGGGDDGASALKILSDGRIVAAGGSWNGTNYDFALARYNADGSLDSAFAGGKVTTAVGNGEDNASDMAIQGDGKIVVTGRSWNGSNFDFALVRYLQ